MRGRYRRRHMLDRLQDKLDEQARHYVRNGVVVCDGHVCPPGKHARAET